MRNPLNKRLPREFKGEFAKYLAIFLFMTATIGFVSGFLVAGNSMIQAYDESFEKYNIENGHFVLEEKAEEETLTQLEKEDVTIYPQFYLEEDTDTDESGKSDSTLRIFEKRTDVNKVCVMDGKLPKSENEIAVDRMYADNNNLKTGDTITVGGKKLEISGLVALSDYSALFSDNSDLMFDAVKFGVAVMTDEGFDSFEDSRIYYNYAWKYEKEPKSEIQEKETSDDFMKVLAQQATIEKYVPRYTNQAINFTGDDMGGDKAMMIVLLYILIVILAFVFAVTINHTIAKEATVIGTLRASGYTRGEMIRHYLAIPMLVTLLAAIIGNILGYTVFKDMVANMYYGSYSLPTYKTIWNSEAFILTTIIPMIIMLITNLVSLAHRLKLSPLRFIRRDLSSQKKKKAVKLPNMKFFTRFRLRIVIQNRSSYITLVIGIVFANILFLFGMMMSPLLSHYQEEVVTNMLADYQYVLKAPVEIEDEETEKYCVVSLKTVNGDEEGEEISVYGVQKDSEYVEWQLPSNGICISDGYAEKYQLKKGDTIVLREAYGNKMYGFQIKKIVEYPSALAVFMPEKQFCETFDKEEGYFNGYFSNTELKDLKKEYVATCITQDDLTKVSRQLDVSMGKMFYLVNIFAVALSALLIYLLTKLILEKNTNSISMVKILGYENGEVARLYLLATTWVVVIALIFGMWISTVVIDGIYRVMMMDYSGWLTLYIAPKVYVEMFVMSMAAYLAVALLQFRKIQKIPMDEALKNVE